MWKGDFTILLSWAVSWWRTSQPAVLFFPLYIREIVSIKASTMFWLVQSVNSCFRANMFPTHTAGVVMEAVMERRRAAHASSVNTQIDWNWILSAPRPEQSTDGTQTKMEEEPWKVEFSSKVSALNLIAPKDSKATMYQQVFFRGFCWFATREKLVQWQNRHLVVRDQRCHLG